MKFAFAKHLVQVRPGKPPSTNYISYMEMTPDDISGFHGNGEHRDSGNGSDSNYCHTSSRQRKSIACVENCEEQPPSDEKGEFEQELAEFDGGLLGIEGSDQVDSLLEDLSPSKLYQDDQFPADDSSLYFSDRLSFGVEWKRPHEISGSPKLFVAGTSRRDVVQGTLGDCWFLSSCAAVARQPELITKIMDPGQSLVQGDGYRGMVQVRFWRFGTWVSVTIDDRLPTRDNRLIYASSVEENEFWPALLEKAYAKIHGSYEAIEGGQSVDALVDLTGGLAERIDLAKVNQTTLYKHLFKSQRAGTFITCSRKGGWQQGNQTDSRGLVQGHAYTVTALARPNHETLGKVSLVRVRNPWADDNEWNGAWSDNDPRWAGISDKQKTDLNIRARSDGEFWMEFGEFCEQFEDVSLCTLEPDFDKDGMFDSTKKVAAVKGEWVAGVNAGGCRKDFTKFATNPQYLLKVFAASSPATDEEDCDEDISTLVTLLQEYRRSQRQFGIRMAQIGVMLYKTSQGGERLNEDHFMYNYEEASSGSYINLREVCLRCQLQPGEYIIVPATYHPDVQASFMIRVFCEAHFEITELK